ncbi:MAG TPA: aminodeoxychorismate synthase component I [Pyrinomonadaceae bacterium]|nr:aminodeoxychorismate synthase component I [Pyrinomonadaceae bacterium]
MRESVQEKGNNATHASRAISVSADELLRALLRLAPARRLSLLDSCGARNSASRLLIAGFDPFEIIEARGNQLFITEGVGKVERVVPVDALDLLDARLAQYKVESAALSSSAIVGACIGTFSYELGRRFERLRNSNPLEADEPDAVLAFYDTLVIHDYRKGSTEIVSMGGERRLQETLKTLSESLHQAANDDESAFASVEEVSSNLSRDEYLVRIRRIKEHIAAGDIYQANLTQRISCRMARGTKPETIFLRLRRDHPASFAAFIRRRDDVIISASPERFLRVESNGKERRVEAWPIKGTRRRGSDPDEDARLRAELLESEKDRAENVMIVDLLRNDLGRVCRYGTVEVVELCALEEHPTLFHLVSKVRGTLREGVSVGELLRATFPCGSITGAPKIRAMEIIDEIEPSPRGLSMGAVGYFSFDGRLDLSVAIRTMVLRDGVATFNVGGGVVADSCPSEEYEESLTKARALLRALGVEDL